MPEGNRVANLNQLEVATLPGKPILPAQIAWQSLNCAL
jgi:hypothetical protein